MAALRVAPTVVAPAAASIVPRISGTVTIKNAGRYSMTDASPAPAEDEEEVSLEVVEALVKAIDRIFLAGAKVDLTKDPGVFDASFTLNKITLKDEHWAAYAREAGLGSLVPGPRTQQAVLQYYKNGRRFSED